MKYTIEESEKHGPCIVVTEWTLADELDDYFGEKEFVLYNRGERKGADGADEFEFWFGKAACVDNVRSIMERFLASIGESND